MDKRTPWTWSSKTNDSTVNIVEGEQMWQHYVIFTLSQYHPFQANMVDSFLFYMGRTQFYLHPRFSLVPTTMLSTYTLLCTQGILLIELLGPYRCWGWLCSRQTLYSLHYHSGPTCPAISYQNIAYVHWKSEYSGSAWYKGKNPAVSQNHCSQRPLLPTL